jgi:hypothetical protein
LSGTRTVQRYGLAKRLAQRKFLSTELLRSSSAVGLQERFRATLTGTASSHAEADDTDGMVSKPSAHKSGRARPKRNKLGLFYVQLCYEQEPTNQPLVAGIDPGSVFEGFSVVGAKDTVLNLMMEAPQHVKHAVETRRTMRRARRGRKWRRPKRLHNRLNRKERIPPSTRSRWEAKARIVAHLKTIMPLTDAVVEDVQAVTRSGKGRKWNAAFSPVQVGKEHLYRLLREMGMRLHLHEGWRTKELRE